MEEKTIVIGIFDQGKFIKVSSGRIGVVMVPESKNSPLYGWYDVWFGSKPNGEPLIERLKGGNDWVEIKTPTGV